MLYKDLTLEAVRQWLDFFPPEGDFHYTKIFDGGVQPENMGHLRKIVYDLVRERRLKHISKGFYRVVKQVEPVRWWDADESEFFDLSFPRSHDDEFQYTYFGFADKVRLSPGDLIIIAGSSNSGKSALALNILGENIDKHPCVVMGNEYTQLDGMPSPKFKRRMMNMKWVEWMNCEHSPKFELLPVSSDFEDYVVPNKINIIDWINLSGDWYMMGTVLQNIKSRIGSGLAVVVLQKKKTGDLAYGQEFTEHLADLYLSVDIIEDYHSRLTVGKTKDSTGRFGRIWGFKIVDFGANIHTIGEMMKCDNCYGKGYTGQGGSYKQCQTCRGTKYIYKEVL